MYIIYRVLGVLGICVSLYFAVMAPLFIVPAFCALVTSVLVLAASDAIWLLGKIAKNTRVVADHIRDMPAKTVTRLEALKRVA